MKERVGFLKSQNWQAFSYIKVKKKTKFIKLRMGKSNLNNNMKVY